MPDAAPRGNPYIQMIMTSITWAGPRCVQELATILGPQNRTQGRCERQLQIP